MTVVGIIGSVDIGPWRLPQKAQSCLVNQYAAKESLTIGYFISELVFSNRCPLLLQAAARDSLDHVVFTSIFQLPSEDKSLSELLSALSETEIHFALEDMHTKVVADSTKQLILSFHQAGKRRVLQQDESLRISLEL